MRTALQPLLPGPGCAPRRAGTCGRPRRTQDSTPYSPRTIWEHAFHNGAGWRSLALGSSETEVGVGRPSLGPGLAHLVLCGPRLPLPPPTLSRAVSGPRIPIYALGHTLPLPGDVGAKGATGKRRL